MSLNSQFVPHNPSGRLGQVKPNETNLRMCAITPRFTDNPEGGYSQLRGAALEVIRAREKENVPNISKKLEIATSDWNHGCQ